MSAVDLPGLTFSVEDALESTASFLEMLMLTKG